MRSPHPIIQSNPSFNFTRAVLLLYPPQPHSLLVPRTVRTILQEGQRILFWILLAALLLVFALLLLLLSPIVLSVLLPTARISLLV